MHLPSKKPLGFTTKCSLPLPSSPSSRRYYCSTCLEYLPQTTSFYTLPTSFLHHRVVLWHGVDQMT